MYGIKLDMERFVNKKKKMRKYMPIINETYQNITSCFKTNKAEQIILIFNSHGK